MWIQDKVEKIVTDMKTRIDAVQTAVSEKEPVSVFVYDSGEDAPFTASAGLPTDMIELAGGKNIFADTESNWTSVDWEDVIAAEPECIIVMDYIASDPIDQKIDFLKNSDILADIPAIQNDNIIVIGLTDVTGCYRSVDALKRWQKHSIRTASKYAMLRNSKKGVMAGVYITLVVLLIITLVLAINL